MAVEVILPKWGLTMEEGTLTEWLVKEGQEVVEGEALANVETDKVTNQLESPVSGVVAKILVEDGTEEIAVGSILCLIEEK